MLVHGDLDERRILLFAQGDDRRYTVEDTRGVRLADLRRGGPQPGYLRLPSGDLFISREGGRGAGVTEEAQIESFVNGTIAVMALAFAPAERSPRGAIGEAFRQGLFAVPFDASYYAGFTDNRGILPVADTDWDVRVWERVVEVRRTDPELSNSEDSRIPDDDDHDHDDHSHPHPVTLEASRASHADWGALSIGIEWMTADESGAELSPRSKTIRADEIRGSALRDVDHVRGLDVRWWSFEADGARGFPGAEGFFRTGYTQGKQILAPAGYSHVAGETTRLSYATVPLFFGGNLYWFEDFPLRPFVGAGVGIDLVRVHYDRHEEKQRIETSTRLGFQLQGGLDLRMSNRFSVLVEVRQLWSQTVAMSHAPDFANDGLTAVTSFKFGFPLGD